MNVRLKTLNGVDIQTGLAQAILLANEWPGVGDIPIHGADFDVDFSSRDRRNSS